MPSQQINSMFPCTENDTAKVLFLIFNVTASPFSVLCEALLDPGVIQTTISSQKTALARFATEVPAFSSMTRNPGDELARHGSCAAYCWMI